ncbi:MAG TPA: autotransporter domain-containing protein [Gammaproteobacteria bacterium]|nr:autotransporter domain-containing protein [Gammaproteobacteria bacterium]
MRKAKFAALLASHRAITATLSALGLVLGAQSAYADCTPDPATTGATVTCTGTDADGFVAGTGVNNLTVNVDSGATVQAKTTVSPSVTIQINNESTVTNNGTVINAGGSQTTNLGININDTDSTITNNGSVQLTISDTDITSALPGTIKGTRTLRGLIATSSASSSPSTLENLSIVNNGSVTLNHAGVGNSEAIYSGEDVDDITFDNFGTVTSNRTQALTITVVGGALQAKTAIDGTNRALGIASGIDSDDDTDDFTVNNHQGAVIEATGDYTAAIYGRAGDLEIDNAGIIRNNSGGIAISAHAASDDGDGELEIDNSGTIIGDILAVDGNALRYWAAKAKGVTGLTLNNQAGVRDLELDNDGTITGNIYLGSGTHEVENDGTITGSIFVDQTGIGTAIGARQFTLENSGTLTGNISIIDFAGAQNSITLSGGGFSGDITATNGTGTNALTLTGAGTLHNVSNFTTLTVTGGAADEDADDDDDNAASAATSWTLASGTAQQFSVGTEIEDGATLTVDSALTSDVTVDSGGTLGGSGTIDGEVTNAGTIDVGSSVLTVTGAVAMAAGSVFKTTISGAGGASADAPSSNAGLLTVGATGTADASATVVPVTSGVIVHNGAWYRIATNSGGGSVFDTVPQIQGSALVSWTIQENAADDLVLGAAVKDPAGIPGLTAGGSGAIEALLSYTGTDPGLLSLGGEVQNLATEDEVRDAGEKLRPNANNAGMQGAINVTDGLLTVIDNRIADAGAGNGMTGLSAGENATMKNFWLQGFGSRGEQDRRDGIDGYTADSAGVAFGVDTAVGDMWRVGLAGSYALSNVDDKGSRRGDSIDFDSFQGAVYGSYNDGPWYFDGIVDFGFHEYDSKRVINIGGFSDTATASYDGWQYTVKGEGGYPLHWDAMTAVPLISLTYSHLSTDSYTETSVAGAALKVDNDDVDSFRTGLGGKLFIPLVMTKDFGSALELHAVWQHEFGDTSQDATASFAAGGNAFNTRGINIGRESVDVGPKLRLVSADGMKSLVVSYDAEVRDEYIGHAGMLTARFEF